MVVKNKENYSLASGNMIKIFLKKMIASHYIKLLATNNSIELKIIKLYKFNKK